MKKYFLIFTLFAMVFSVTLSVAHACTDIETSVEISATHDIDSSDTDEAPLASHDCEMACGGCCIHHISTSSADTLIPSVSETPFPFELDVVLSDVAYGLKRPPKS